MQIDDRLATVLRQRAAGERAARTQFRQLLDLLNQRRDDTPAQLEETGWQRLLDLSDQIPPADRARILREEGWHLRNLALILFLTEQEPEVAASALAAAALNADEWLMLIPELPLRSRGFLRLRRDLPARAEAALERLGVQDRGLPPPSDIAAQENLTGRAASQTLGAESDRRDDEIKDLLRRIEAFQAARKKAAEAQADRPDAEVGAPERQPEQAVVRLFHFTSDDRGRINWTDEAVAPMVVGTSLDDVFAGTIIPAAGSPPFRLANRLPLRAADAAMSGADAIAGGWVVDAVPQFAPVSGRFTGYAGRFCRPPEPAPDPSDKAREQADALRQVLHELRTPVNAIQGYAELIQQQMVGPVPHAYRALAAGIGGDAARILAAFADLEQLARLESSEPGINDRDRSDIAPIVAATVRQLRPALQPQAAGFDLIIEAGGARVPLTDADAELLVWRLLASLAASASEQEIMEVHLEQRGTVLNLSCELPATLRAVDDLFVNELPTGQAPVTPGLFGSGFALRLARAQSRAVEGDLRRSGDRLLLTLPVAPEARPNRTDSNAA